MKYKIEVTAKHIKEGKKKVGSSCPVALACRDVFQMSRIMVGYVTLDIDSEKVNLSQKATDFISRFDEGEKVKPFSFYVKVD